MVFMEGSRTGDRIGVPISVRNLFHVKCVTFHGDSTSALGNPLQAPPSIGARVQTFATSTSFSEPGPTFSFRSLAGP